MGEKVLNLRGSKADRPFVSENPSTPAAPAAGDVVEIVDRVSGVRVTAVVESATEANTYVLRYDRGSKVPDEAHLRWFDGDTAWQAIAKLHVLDDTSAECELAPCEDWEPAPVRRSLRAPVDNSPMLVKIVSSTVLAKGRRVHAVCLDISDSGCRASWPGRTPLVGDAVDVAWEVGDWQANDEPGWVSARVARIVALPFGARQVGFTFEIANADQAARVRAWHQAWLHEHRQRLLDQRAA
ncbi:MAG: hypothetical protein QOI71_2810 [Gaiellales bacterium]|jgi:hypothetical protein|nr:hypothetical protein [Gaiellales bacterium]